MTASRRRSQKVPAAIPTVQAVLTTDKRPGLVQNEGPVDIPVDLTQEYVSAGGYGWYGAMKKALPHYIDDLSARLGDDIYVRMMVDPQVAKNINQLKLSVLSDDFSFTPRITDEADPNYQISQEIADFCTRAVDALEVPFTQVLFGLLDALAVGHKVAEKTWMIVEDKDSQDYGRLILKTIKVKPYRSTALVVDAYNNLVGVEALLAGSGMSSVLTGGILGDLSSKSNRTGYLQNLIPREKVIIFTNMPANSDWRGTSLLRPAYEAWWFKRQIMPELRRYMAQFAVPSLLGFTPPGAKATQLTHPGTGTPRVDSNGYPITVSPEQVMAEALRQFENGSAAVFPGESKVEPLSVPSNGQMFLALLDHLDTDIEKAITLQTLASSDAAANARAASAVHQDILDMLIRFIKISLSATIETDLLYWITLYNYGPTLAATCVPNCVLAKVEQHNFNEQATAISQLASAGVLHDSQLPGIDSMLNLPPRDMDQIRAEKQAELEANMGGPTGVGQGVAPSGAAGEYESGDADLSGNEPQQPGETAPVEGGPATVPDVSGNIVDATGESPIDSTSEELTPTTSSSSSKTPLNVIDATGDNSPNPPKKKGSK